MGAACCWGAPALTKGCLGLPLALCSFGAGWAGDHNWSSTAHCVCALSQCIPLVCYRWELSAMTTNSTISRPIVSSQG